MTKRRTNRRSRNVKNYTKLQTYRYFESSSNTTLQRYLNYSTNYSYDIYTEEWQTLYLQDIYTNIPLITSYNKKHRLLVSDGYDYFIYTKPLDPLRNKKRSIHKVSGYVIASMIRNTNAAIKNTSDKAKNIQELQKIIATTWSNFANKAYATYLKEVKEVTTEKKTYKTWLDRKNRKTRFPTNTSLNSIMSEESELANLEKSVGYQSEFSDALKTVRYIINIHPFDLLGIGYWPLIDSAFFDTLPFNLKLSHANICDKLLLQKYIEIKRSAA